jgi:hypothetical protein
MFPKKSPFMRVPVHILSVKRTSAILLTLIATLQFNAQIIFEKGYVVNSKGDTLKGEVKLNIADTTEYYDKAVFRDEKGQKNFFPEKTRAYGVGNRHFVSIKVHGEAAFYEVLTRGHISFYKRLLEAIKMNELATELEYYIAVGDKKPYVLGPEKFRRQLVLAMEDNDSFATGYQGKEFDQSRVAETIAAYNDWKSKAKK